ncbi:hypothetical protein MHYP_G00293790 [Metynnis hypsauchen]
MSVTSAQSLSSVRSSTSSLQPSSSDVSSSSSAGASTQLDHAIAFCEDCREVVKDMCLCEGKHRKHKLFDLQKAVVSESERLEKRFNLLRKTVQKTGNIKEQVSKAKKNCDDTHNRIKDNMEDLYRELWELLEQNQQQALRLLETERETLQKSLNQLDIDGNHHQERLTDIQESIEKLETTEETQPEDLLKEIKGHLESLETMAEFYSITKEQMTPDAVERKDKFDDVRLKALEDSVRKIVEKNKELLPQPWDFSVAISFNKSKKHKDLSILEDGTVLLRGSSARQTKKHVASWCSVVAVQSFSEHQHYWEVEVGGSQSWAVGVVEQDWEKNGLHRPLGRDKESWALESDEGDLMALHGDELRGIKDPGIHRLGVCVDQDKSRIKFYNANSGKLLHVFFTKFKSAIYPAFSIRNTGHRIQKLTICKLFTSFTYADLEDGDAENIL